MIIKVLVCRPDGTQAIESREMPDDWFAAPEDEEVLADHEADSFPHN